MNKHWNIDDYDQTTGEELHQAHARLKEKVWERISDMQDTPKAQVWSFKYPAGIAAALLLVFCSYFLWFNDKPTIAPTISQQTNPTPTPAIQKELKDSGIATIIPPTLPNQDPKPIAPNIKPIKERSTPVEIAEAKTPSISETINNIPNDIEPDTIITMEEQDNAPSTASTNTATATPIHINDIQALHQAAPIQHSSTFQKILDDAHQPMKQANAIKISILKRKK